MSDELQRYEGNQLAVTFDGHRCIHARECVTGLPSVFRANVEGPWIVPDGANAEELAALIRRCPSGALQFERMDGGTAEAPPERNVVRIQENGPLAIRGVVTLNGKSHGARLTLCRCGQSQNKPFCDLSHRDAGFTATGEPKSDPELGDMPPHETLTITTAPNGPLLLAGPMEVVSGTGRGIKRATKAAFCRCGHSKNKPFCDGSHKTVGFSAD